MTTVRSDICKYQLVMVSLFSTPCVFALGLLVRMDGKQVWRLLSVGGTDRPQATAGGFHSHVAPLAAVRDSYTNKAGSAHKSDLIMKSIQIWPLKQKW